MVEWGNEVVRNLTNEQQMLVECIGIDAYKRLVRTYGGMNLYVIKEETALRIHRDKEIRSKYTGNNLKELAKVYNLSERKVRDIVFDIDKAFCDKQQVNIDDIWK